MVSSRNACVCWMALILWCRSHGSGSTCQSSCGTVENALIHILDRFSAVQAFQVFLVHPHLAICFHPLSSHCPCAFPFPRYSASPPVMFFKREDKQAEGWHRSGTTVGSFTERLHYVSLTFSVCSLERPWQRLLFAAHSFPHSASAARKVAHPRVWISGLCSESFEHHGIAADAFLGPAMLLVG